MLYFKRALFLVIRGQYGSQVWAAVTRLLEYRLPPGLVWHWLVRTCRRDGRKRCRLCLRYWCAAAVRRTQTSSCTLCLRCSNKHRRRHAAQDPHRGTVGEASLLSGQVWTDCQSHRRFSGQQEASRALERKSRTLTMINQCLKGECTTNGNGMVFWSLR